MKFGDGKKAIQEQRIEGSYAYLADMIREVQQMADCIGATEASSYLEAAYLTVEEVSRPVCPPAASMRDRQ